MFRWLKDPQGKLLSFLPLCSLSNLKAIPFRLYSTCTLCMRNITPVFIKRIDTTVCMLGQFNIISHYILPF